MPELGPPKSKAGFRTVPIPDVVGAALAEHIARYGTGPGGLVFANTLGKPLRRRPAGEMWHRAARTPDCRPGRPSMTSATSMPPPDRRGCSVKAVQRRLGHQSAMETLDTYGHLWPDSDDETRTAVDHVLAGVDERRAV